MPEPMTNRELADATARAMGWVLERIFHGVGSGTTLRRGWVTPITLAVQFWEEDWQPAADWRDTGVVLEWVLEQNDNTNFGHHGPRKRISAAPQGCYNIGAFYPDQSADTWQRAICLAAVEIAKSERASEVKPSC